MAERQRKPQVLVVDDEEDMCWALRLIITTEGRDCVSVNTAAEAIRIVTTEPFCLAFVDVKLPDMNGFDLVRGIRRRVPGLPCVLVSGFLYHDDNMVREGLQSGLIAGFVGKPFLVAQLQDMLNRFAAVGGAQLGESPSGNPIPPRGIRGSLEQAAGRPDELPPNIPNPLPS